MHVTAEGEKEDGGHGARGEVIGARHEGLQPVGHRDELTFPFVYEYSSGNHGVTMVPELYAGRRSMGLLLQHGGGLTLTMLQFFDAPLLLLRRAALCV